MRLEPSYAGSGRMPSRSGRSPMFFREAETRGRGTKIGSSSIAL